MRDSDVEDLEARVREDEENDEDACEQCGHAFVEHRVEEEFKRLACRALVDNHLCPCEGYR
jgi:uncharacterized cysteine cluster protein YcgN (CxxCxxCC family)